MSRSTTIAARLLYLVTPGAPGFVRALFSRKTWSTVAFCAPALLFAPGCATLDAKVAIPVSCIKDAPAVPVTATEAELLAMSEYASTLTIWTERLELKAYALKAEAVISACR